MASLDLDSGGVIAACGQCGRRNRVKYERLGDPVRCGDCKAAISVSRMPLDVQSSADFDRLVAHSSIPIVVDYWAPWCGPCRMVAPELAKVAARSEGRFLIVKVNTDALPDLGERFAIRSIPTMALFAGGAVKARTTGARPAEEIERFIEQAL